MKKIFMFLLITFIILLSGCSSKNIKNNLTADDIVTLYSTSQYETFVTDYTSNETIQYDYSVKVYNKEDDSNDYLFIYLFNDDNTAKDFYKLSNSKTGFIHLFGLIYGENLHVKYENLNYMVLEYTNRTSKDMIKIYKDFIYE